MSVTDNFLNTQKEIPEGIDIVIVSKFQEAESIMQIYNCGHRMFGENKVQEILRKKPMLPDDIQWHMIGHLQTNKVKYIAPYISIIHSIDSLKLLIEINKEAVRNERTIDCLLQFYIATEESKFGLDIEEAHAIIESESFKTLNNVHICGVMGMASFTNDLQIVRNEFSELHNIFNEFKNKHFKNDNCFRHISMGMSNDYHIAIDEGATILRIGSKIFS